MSESAPRERDASVREDVGAAIKREGREIAGEARSAAHRLARDQRDAVAGFVSAVVGAATRGAEELEESGFSRSATAVRRTADEVDSLAHRLQQRDPGELWNDVEDFAREHPVVVFGAGFALAFGLARFLKSGRADEVDRSDDGGDTESSTAYESAAAGSLSDGNPTSPAGMPSSQPLPSMGATPPAAGN